MWAAVYQTHGPPDVLEYKEVARPDPLPRQLLIEIIGAAVNPVDLKLRENPMPEFLLPLPKIGGGDFVGRIIKAPVGSAFEPGQLVYGMMPLLGSPWGSYAQYAAVDEDLVALAPSSIPLEECACFPLVGTTVLQALDPIITAMKGDTEGKRIYIQAGLGGVGSFAVQYCKNVLRMHVTATCGGDQDSVKMLHELGADQVIDYHCQFDDVKQDYYDVILDPMAYLYEQQTLESGMLKQKHGHYINIAASNWTATKKSRDFFQLAIPEARPTQLIGGKLKQGWHAIRSWCGLKCPRYYHVFVVHNRDALVKIRVYVEKGLIRPYVDSRYRLRDLKAAHEKQASGTAHGKILIQIRPEHGQQSFAEVKEQADQS
jgi:alcohol dehydrogenase